MMGCSNFPAVDGDTSCLIPQTEESERYQDEPKEFTDITGGNGAWQIKFLLLSIIAGINAPWHSMIMPFYSFPQDYWCARPNDVNISIRDWWETALPDEIYEGQVRHSHCEMFVANSTVHNSPFRRKNVTYCSDWEYDDTYELSLKKQWNLVCDKEWMLSMSQSIYMGGFLASALISGQMADMFGRHPIMMLNIVILIISSTAAVFSTSLLMFAVLRFFIAAGHAGLYLTMFVIMIETVGSSHRTLFSFLQGLGWGIGYTILPLLGWYVQVWYVLQLVITLPCFFFLLFYWLLPESPRWLLTHGHLKEAINVMSEIAKFNGKVVPDLEIQAKKLCYAVEKEENFKVHATIIDLLRTPNLRKWTLYLYFIWTTLAFVFYGLSLNTALLGGNFYVTFSLSGLVEVFATIYCIIVAKFSGRKRPLIFSLVTSAIFCAFCIFISNDMHWLKVSVAMLGKFFISCAFNLIHVYTAEIYPTVSRNVGVGSCSTISRIGAIIAPFMNELGNKTSASVPMALFAILSLISGFLTCLLPETDGHSIPETLQQAENFGKKNNRRSSFCNLSST